MAELRDRVCPHCKRSSTSGLEERCPADGFAFVTTNALAKSDGDPLLGAPLEGGFIGLELCATGSLSAIYRGRGPSSSSVAIKAMRLDGPMAEPLVAAWQRETRALTMTSSPSLVRIMGKGKIDSPSAVFVALEWLEGETLAERLRRGPISVDLAVRFAIDMAEALRALHENGLIHGDLKPANAMVLAPSTLKLFDLGCSVEEGQAPQAITPLYAAPEVVAEEVVDRRTDLYTLGAVLHHVLTGRPPFVGTAEHIRREHLATAPTRASSLNPAVPPFLDDIVLRLLEKAPRDRPASAEAVLRDLRSGALTLAPE